VVLTRGKVLGVEVTEWRIPLRYTFEPASGVGQLDVTDSTATVAQGRVTGQLRAVWTDFMRLSGKVNFVGVELHQAFPAAKFGMGKATGHAEFTGVNVKTVEDVQGTLVASLQQTQALAYPVLKQLAPILGLSSTATFQSGDLRTRLTRGGVVHIERLSFPEGPLQLYAEGQVTLQGRVNLDVTANTGKLANLLAMVGVRLPDTGTIGGELLKRATAALSPNLVRVHVGGTVHQPSVQVVPLPMLTDQALRFFAGMR
jgi:translocation and assembly module TamB